MKRFTRVLCALTIITALLLFSVFTSEATVDIRNKFIARYGPQLFDRFSCQLCHGPGGFEDFNPYGREVRQSVVDNSGCLEFYPPNTHTIAMGVCEYMHAEGLFTPFSSGCTTCHGVTLEGLIAPSCYQCHNRRWDEDGPARVGSGGAVGTRDLNAAFKDIEKLDSDGDGYSNIEEINAGSHPGDANIIPGSDSTISVEFSETTWRRTWFNEIENFVVMITPGAITRIDFDLGIYLETADARLYFTRVADMGDIVQASIPRALLCALFKDINGPGGTVTVVAHNEFGERIADSVDVTLAGKAPGLVDGLRLVASPKKWEAGDDDVTLEIRGDGGGEVDETRSFTVFGPAGAAVLHDVQRKGGRISGTISSTRALGLVGAGMESTPYMISVVGFGNQGDTRVVLKRTVQVVPAGGGDNCLDFNPPSFHNVPRGVCEYLHAPGAEEPFANNCGACHGADLTGSGSAPSCFLCHGALWNQASRPAPGAAK